MSFIIKTILWWKRTRMANKECLNVCVMCSGFSLGQRLIVWMFWGSEFQTNFELEIPLPGLSQDQLLTADHYRASRKKMPTSQCCLITKCYDHLM